MVNLAIARDWAKGVAPTNSCEGRQHPSFARASRTWPQRPRSSADEVDMLYC
jgi:hypothetical protein